jgi:hypothetical protein
MKNINISINMNAITAIALVCAMAFGFYAFRDSAPAPEESNYEYMQISVIESVVKAGIGRSRMISVKDNGEMVEEKLENFFSVSGINFSNVRFNDNVITERISTLTKEGWILENCVTGAYSDGKSTGLYLTRYLFKRPRS